MDQIAILALVFVPFAGFWTSFLLEWKPATALKGTSKDIVEWLLGYHTQVVTSITLVLGVLCFIGSLVAFFAFDELKAAGLIQWYFVVAFGIIAFVGVATFLVKLLMVKGKSAKLIE